MEAPQYFFIVLPLLTSILLVFFMIKTLKSEITKPKYSHKSLPPGPRRLPIIGNLHNMKGEHPHRRLATLAKTYGPIFYLKLGEINSVVITSPTLAAETMKTHDLNFASRSQFLATKIILYDGGDLVFAPYGKLWALLRKICTVELFSGKRVKSFVSIMEEVGHNMVEKIRMGKPGSPVNISQLLLSVANTTVSRTAFGRDCEQSDRLFTAVFSSFKYMSGFDLADLYPSLSFLLAGLTGLRRRSEKVRRDFDVILNEILEAHLEKSKGRDDDAEEDLVDVMLRLKNSGELEDFISMDNIKAVIVVLTSAAGDAVAVRQPATDSGGRQRATASGGGRRRAACRGGGRQAAAGDGRRRRAATGGGGRRRAAVGARKRRPAASEPRRITLHWPLYLEFAQIWANFKYTQTGLSGVFEMH